MLIKYVENSFSKTGTYFKDVEFKDFLNHCLTLPPNGEKHKYGSVFVYNSNQLGIHTEETISLGIILIDFDNISKETANKIYNNFELLCEHFPPLLAIQYSSSYYINPSKAGLHLFVKSEELNYIEYKKQATICTYIIVNFIEHFLGIKLEDESNKEVIDLHNTILWHRFNLFYSTYKYNDNFIPFSLDLVKFDQLERLIVKYNIKLDNEIKKVITPVANNISIGDNISKLKIDRYFHIGTLSGNDIRFRISIIADKLFGENAKQFCDKFFYYEKNKSIYTHYSKANTIHPLIYKWLIEKGYITENKNNIINEWLDEKSDEIIRLIQDNNQLEIIGPTGSGKTTFINNYLARYFNSVVIVPFNVTNKLYDNLTEVNSNYIGKVPQNSPVVMIWDQAFKHWDEIKDRHIIVDEAHTLFFDRNYRDSAIKLMLLLKENKSNVTFITATPAGEKELFNMPQIRYFKERNLINLNIKATENIEWAQYNYIKKALDNNWYDKIILLDDNTAKKIYEQFIVNGYSSNISYIRSSTKETQDFKDLRDTELLTKRLTICTCVAFNGLNFKNKNENILVIGSIVQGYTTACEIIQQIGRIRNSKVKSIYFYNPEKFYENDIDEKQQKALEFNNLYIQGVPDNALNYERKYLDNSYVDALKEIQKYQIKHSTIESIIEELSATGYITGIVEDKINKDSAEMKMNLALKRKESDEMKEDILNGIFLSKEYDTDYQKKWASDINYLISNPFYNGITLDTFIELFQNTTKNKLIETCIENIKDIIKFLQIDQREYDNLLNNMGLYLSMLSSEVSKSKFKSTVKRISNIRDKYLDKITFKDNSIYFNDIITDVIENEAIENEKYKEGHKTGGKKGHSIIINGVEYSTVTEAAEKLHISRPTVYKMLS